MRIVLALLFFLTVTVSRAQILPDVDPDLGPVTGEVYVDVDRLTAARLTHFESVEHLIDSKTLDFPSIEFNLTSVPLAQVLQLYFSEVARSPYVICSEVLSDSRFVSLRASGRALDRAMLVALLEANGLALNMVGGVATVCVKAPELTEEQKAARHGKVFTYRPKNRSVSDLIRVASPLVVGIFANGNSGSGVPLSMLGGRSSSASTDLPKNDVDEVLVFSGEQTQIDRLKDLLHALDSPITSVMVRAVLYEVSAADTKASALKVLADMFNGNFGVTIGATTGSFANSLSITSSHFDFIASMISEDSRFKVLTRPFLRVQNGRSARFQVGQDVPVAGEILFNPNGQATQSVKYVSSGVILDVAAQVRGNSIGLDVIQTVSNFVKTTVGNSENPTLNKRELATSLTLTDGEIVVLGGLNDVQEERSGQGLFGWNFAKSEATREGQLLLLLQAEKI